MTPKEKAIELVNKFYGYIIYENESVYSEKMLRVFKIKAKNCALIAVDEILQSLGYKKLSDSPYTTLEARQYYVEVKQEIEAL
jgi:hypothetical protein